ncbi:MAG TPA: hypothetical protein VFH89_13225 [Sphingomicrobium sp.]|nr:hypothetical protein [Sphingomicrobium sp.]
MLVGVVADAEDDWWIIGSAAVALHGADVPSVRDVDLLMSTRDAGQLLKRVGGRPRDSKPSAQFRSEVFGTWYDPPLPIEVMGGFSLNTANGWRPVLLETREERRVEGYDFYVPCVGELKDLLRSFGRPKDIERALLL